MSVSPAAHWSAETILLLNRGIALGRRLTDGRKKILVEKIVRHQSIKYGIKPLQVVAAVLGQLSPGDSFFVQGSQESGVAGEQPAIGQTTPSIDLKLLKRLLGDNLPTEPSDAMQFFETRISEWMRILGRLAPDAECVDAAISTVVNRIQNSDTAMKAASQESFGRLLQALSPEQMKKSVEKGPTKVGPFLKAAWFDAFEEKHGQLVAYHTKGFLSRDLRDMYRRQLKNLPSE